jgi:hypothetical protein
MIKKSIVSFLCSFLSGGCLLVICSAQLFAQTQPAAVPVEQEPHHRIVFENKKVRIYDALIPPGEATLFHTHVFDSVSVTVNGGQARNEIVGKPVREYTQAAGTVTFSRATGAPYTHRITNLGTTPLRFVVPEILSLPASPGAPSALDAVPGHQFVLENDSVEVYRISVDPGQSTGARSRTLPWVRISLSQSAVSVRGQGRATETLDTKPGDYRWYEGPGIDTVENVGPVRYEAIEIEFR